jgi:hypothetical protein
MNPERNYSASKVNDIIGQFNTSRCGANARFPRFGSIAQPLTGRPGGASTCIIPGLEDGGGSIVINT